METYAPVRNHHPVHHVMGIFSVGTDAAQCCGHRLIQNRERTCRRIRDAGGAGYTVITEDYFITIVNRDDLIRDAYINPDI